MVAFSIVNPQQLMHAIRTKLPTLMRPLDRKAMQNHGFECGPSCAIQTFRRQIQC